jgi:protein-disulfide isomerase
MLTKPLFFRVSLPATCFAALAGGLVCAATPNAGAPLAADATIATIDGKPIPYADLVPTVKDQIQSLQHQYDTQLAELTLSLERTRADLVSSTASNLLNNRLLGLESKAQNTTIATLVGGIKVPEVTEAQVKEFYEHHAGQLGKPLDAVGPQIKQYLAREADEKAKREYFETLRTKYKGTLTLEPMREKVEASGPQRGPNDAPVTIVEFSDFECPFCGRLEPVFGQLQKAYPTQVRLIYRHMPLTSQHPSAGRAAEAAVCAEKQGKFWEMHDLLFAEQTSLSDAALKEKAKRIGLEAKVFDACLDSGDAKAALKVDQAAYEKLGLSATPVSFVNGRFVNGAVTYDNLMSIVEDELRRKSTKM